MTDVKTNPSATLRTGVLYYGDNLDILRHHIPDESIDLIYLDPPFNSNRSYNVLFREETGAASAAQIEAFEDTWNWAGAAATYDEVMRGPHQQVARFLKAMVEGLGHNDVTAYLTMMAIRLVELRRGLKPTGSIYLHCDPTASHYLRLLMDAVFGVACFQNEVIWSYRRWPSPSNHFQRMHDVLLFYAKSPAGPGAFNVEYEENSPSYIRRFKGKTQMLDPETKTRKITLESDSKGLPQRDVWEISIIAGFGKERLGYPTQKPLALLERIVTASSNPGDIVLDPFCGCGTAVHAAHKLGRRWIGIDITYLAIGLIRRRMQDAFPGIEIEEIGAPVDLAGARALAAHDKYQFQWWALDRLGAQPVSGKKKGADRGIDGVIPFFAGPKEDYRRAIMSVKGGEHVNVAMVRDLIGVLDREGEPVGILLTLAPPHARHGHGGGSRWLLRQRLLEAQVPPRADRHRRGDAGRQAAGHAVGQDTLRQGAN
jgi:DNA modification methylase